MLSDSSQLLVSELLDDRFDFNTYQALIGRQYLKRRTANTKGDQLATDLYIEKILQIRVGINLEGSNREQ